jgi:hypothetical protein
MTAMNEKWMRDTGLVLGLVCLVLGFNGHKGFLVASGILILLALLSPKLLYPLAWVWLKLVFILNLFVPKIFFGLVFFLIITPVGLARRALKGDMLLIKGWRKAATAFVERDRIFSREDLETPY